MGRCYEAKRSALPTPISKPYTPSLPDSGPSDPTLDTHILNFSHTSQMYKTLIQGGYFNQQIKNIERVDGAPKDIILATAFMHATGKENLVAMGLGDEAFLVVKIVGRLKEEGNESRQASRLLSQYSLLASLYPHTMSKAHRVKQPPHYGNWTRAERDDYDLELVEPSSPGEPYRVKATLTPKSLYRFGSENDSLFNISSMLGNDNGAFWWGRPGFEAGAPADKFKLELDSCNRSYVLSGELPNHRGELVQASINIDDRLELDEYIHEQSGETFYRLQEQNHRARRTIILCFDGTSNHFSKRNTNVVKFMELLVKDDPRQMVYYQTGVGTYSHPSIMSSTGRYVAELLDEGIAWYLYQHIIDGYKFLMQTYQAGDKIAIIGFSRGAFTARALAGMLHCVGLLPKYNVEHVPFAYEVYKNSRDYTADPAPKDKQGEVIILGKSGGVSYPTIGSRPQDVSPADFKRAFCSPVVVDFVGVWDTVASVGVIYSGPALPWIGYNPSILTFRQALALDEHRGNFIPSLWDHRYTQDHLQTARDVWFRGEHTDIGGGSRAPTLDKEDPADPYKANQKMPSNITLRWMVRQCIESKSGVLFDPEAMHLARTTGVLENPEKYLPEQPQNDAFTPHYSRMNASAALDQKDAESYDIYNTISAKPWLWNLLEILPGPKPTNTLEPSTTW
ncbi:hypothetical protein FRC07_009610, partial [Ceratobasidium sp. 392]